jgi:hypothetical protein
MMGGTKKLLLLGIGCAFIPLGVIGFFLPFLHGILFIFIGLIILYKENEIARDILIHLKKRYPGPFRSIRNYVNGSEIGYYSTGWEGRRVMSSEHGLPPGAGSPE